jgi:hypothetical protein
MYYVNRFNEIFNGSPWYGETFEAKVNGITDLNAFVQPFNAAHSAAEIVAHMTYWRKGLVARLEGDNIFFPSMEDANNWVTIEKLKAKGWENILDDFNQSQNQIIHLLPQKTDDFLGEEYSKGSTFEYLIQGIIDHDIYHLGQLGLIKRLNQG